MSKMTILNAGKAVTNISEYKALLQEIIDIAEQLEEKVNEFNDFELNIEVTNNFEKADIKHAGQS